MRLTPQYADTFSRVASGDLAEGSDDHTTFCALRTLRGHGLVAHVSNGRPQWVVTPSGAAC